MNLCTACDDGTGSVHQDPSRGHPHADGERCPWPLLEQPGTRCECTANHRDRDAKAAKRDAQQRAEDKLVELLARPGREPEIRAIVRDIIAACR